MFALIIFVFLMLLPCICLSVPAWVSCSDFLLSWSFWCFPFFASCSRLLFAHCLCLGCELSWWTSLRVVRGWILIKCIQQVLYNQLRWVWVCYFNIVNNILLASFFLEPWLMCYDYATLFQPDFPFIYHSSGVLGVIRRVHFPPLVDSRQVNPTFPLSNALVWCPSYLIEIVFRTKCGCRFQSKREQIMILSLSFAIWSSLIKQVYT